MTAVRQEADLVVRMSPAAFPLDRQIDVCTLLMRDLGQQIQRLKDAGVTIVLCEQNTKCAIGLSDRTSVLEKGQVRFSGTSAALQGNAEVRQQSLAL